MLTMYARNWWALALRGVLAVILAFRLHELFATAWKAFENRFRAI